MRERKNLSVRNNFVPPNNPIIEHAPNLTQSTTLFESRLLTAATMCILKAVFTKTLYSFLRWSIQRWLCCNQGHSIGKASDACEFNYSQNSLEWTLIFYRQLYLWLPRQLKPHLNSSLKRIILNHSCTCAFVSGQAAPVADTFSTSQGTVLFWGLPLYRIMFTDMEKWIHHVFQ